MKKTFKFLMLLAPLAILSSCGEDGGDASKIERTAVDMSETMLASLKQGSINFEGNRKTTYTSISDVVEEGTEKVFIGKSSYSFNEYSNTTESTVTDVTYFKDGDGKVITYEIDYLNKVSETMVEGGKLVFDEVYYNPFKDLTLSDFILEDGKYHVNEEKEDAFWKPFSFYNEIVTEISLTPYSDGTMDIEAKSRDSGVTYISEISGTISLSKKEDIDTPSPYKTESYHADLQAAYDALIKANNFTYHRKRKPVDESVDVEEEVYDAKISKKDPRAVVFVYDGIDQNGVARYDDGNDYKFTISDGKAVKGDSDSTNIPFNVGTVKMEVFEKVDDTHFKARTADIAKKVAGFLMEKLGDAILVDGSIFGDNGCDSLTFEVENKTLKGFEYYVTRSTESGSSYKEKNEVSIDNVGTTKIEYEFKTEEKKEEPAFDITQFVGNFEGYNVVSYSDNSLHSMSITDIDNMALDGKKMVFHSKGPYDGCFNAVWDDSRYVQISVSSRYGYTVKEADSDSFSSFSKGVTSFYLNLAKKGENKPTLSEVAISNGWTFEDDEEIGYKIKISTTLENSKFYVQERVDGSWQYVEKAMSNISFDEMSATLSFEANDDAFTMAFYSNEQGIVKNASGTIKGFLSPASEY